MRNEQMNAERIGGSEAVSGGWSRVLAAVLIAGIGALGVAGLSGCQTTKGVGDDLENLGDNISDEAEDASN